MAKRKEGVEEGMLPGEMGIWPQQLPEIEQQQSPEEPQTTSVFPVVVEGKPRKGGKQLTIQKGEQVIKLDKFTRQSARQLTVDEFGDVVATPAGPQIRGGGIAPIDPNLVMPDVDKTKKDSHKKSTHRDLGFKK